MNRNTAAPKIKITPPGPNTKKWINYHLTAAAKATYETQFVWDRSAPAIGPFCTDPDGNLFLDFASHVATNPLGYNHPELIAISKALAEVTPDRYAGTDFICAYGKTPSKSKYPTPSHLHEKLIKITKQFGFGKAFLVNSGAEAVENAIKLSYSHRQNYGYGFAFDKAFHGRTLGALTLNASKEVHRRWYPKIPKVIHFPSLADTATHTHTHSPTTRQEGHFTSIKKMLDPKTGLINPAEVAYIILEPIQGEGGYLPAEISQIKEIARIAKKHKIPLICDEIQSGLGRTGKWWACEHFGIKPDIITSGKALQIGAVIGKPELFPDEAGRIGGTWCEGNAIASAVGATIINIIERDNLLKNAELQGKYLKKELIKIQKRYPQKIIDVRGIGLMLAIELSTVNQRNHIREQAMQKGLLLLGCGDKAIRFLPPLDVTKREIDMALEILSKVLSK